MAMSILDRLMTAKKTLDQVVNVNSTRAYRGGKRVQHACVHLVELLPRPEQYWGSGWTFGVLGDPNGDPADTLHDVLLCRSCTEILRPAISRIEAP